MKSWLGYYDAVGNEPNTLVRYVLHHVTRRGTALDLGAGNLRDCMFLRDNGFSRVIPVDSSWETREFSTDMIVPHISPVEKYAAPANSVDLVVSCNTLFHLNAEQVRTTFENTYRALRNGGVFACNVNGNNDDTAWEGTTSSSFSAGEILDIGARFETLAIEDKRELAIRYLGFGVANLRRKHQIIYVARKR